MRTMYRPPIARELSADPREESAGLIGPLQSTMYVFGHFRPGSSTGHRAYVVHLR